MCVLLKRLHTRIGSSSSVLRDASYICILPRVPGSYLTMPSWSHAGKTAVPLRYLECMCPCGHGKTWPAKGQPARMGSYVALHMWNTHEAMRTRKSIGGSMWSRATRDSVGSLQHGISCVSRAAYMKTWLSMCPCWPGL